MRRAAVLLGAIGLAALASGCGAARPIGPPASPAVQQEVFGLDDTVVRLDQDVVRALPAGGQLNCDRACFLSRNICAIAGRICAIADRHPGDGEVRARCRDATERCQRARARAAERCRCL